MNNDTNNISKLYSEQVKLDEAGGLIDKARSKIPAPFGIGQAGQQKAARNVTINNRQKELKKAFDYRVPGEGFLGKVTGQEIQGFFNNLFSPMISTNDQLKGFLPNRGLNPTLDDIDINKKYSRREARKILDNAVQQGYDFMSTGVVKGTSSDTSPVIPPEPTPEPTPEPAPGSEEELRKYGGLTDDETTAVDNFEDLQPGDGKIWSDNDTGVRWAKDENGDVYYAKPDTDDWTKHSSSDKTIDDMRSPMNRAMNDRMDASPEEESAVVDFKENDLVAWTNRDGRPAAGTVTKILDNPNMVEITTPNIAARKFAFEKSKLKKINEQQYHIILKASKSKPLLEHKTYFSDLIKMIEEEPLKETISFRDFFLAENVYIRDQDEWIMLYHEMWWDFIDRAHSEAPEDVKAKIQGLKPGYIVTGPTEQVNFYEINEPPSPHVVFQKKHTSEDQGPEKVFSIHNYTLEDVKDWWDEQMEYYGKYKAGTLNMDPPDPADAWKDQDDEIPGTDSLEEIIAYMKRTIENSEPAGDVKGLYWDAIEHGADKDQLDADLQHYVKLEYLTQEEVEYIQNENA